MYYFPCRELDPRKGRYGKRRTRGGTTQGNGSIKFETDMLTPKEISTIFDRLPMDITLVDKNGIVKYFSLTEERVFARTKAVIDRDIGNCYPKPVYIL